MKFVEWVMLKHFEKLTIPKDCRFSSQVSTVI